MKYRVRNVCSVTERILIGCVCAGNKNAAIGERQGVVHVDGFLSPVRCFLLHFSLLIMRRHHKSLHGRGIRRPVIRPAHSSVSIGPLSLSSLQTSSVLLLTPTILAGGGGKAGFRGLIFWVESYAGSLVFGFISLPSVYFPR